MYEILKDSTRMVYEIAERKVFTISFKKCWPIFFDSNKPFLFLGMYGPVSHESQNGLNFSY